MEKPIEMDELQELQSQYNILNEKLNDQKIVNEDLIKETVKQNITFIDQYCSKSYRQAWWGFVLLLPLMIYGRVHWALILVSLGALFAADMFGYRAFRVFNPKELIGLCYVDAMERIQKYKKTMKRIRMFTIAPFILMVVLVLGSLSDWTYSGSTVSGGIAGLVIGVIYDYRKNRELYAKIKDILDKIKELRGE